MLLRLLLKIDEESVASFHHITRVSPKSRMSQTFVGVDNYTPQDCKSLHEAVSQVIVPVVNQIMENRQQALRLARLRPWDVNVDPKAFEEPRRIEHVDLLEEQCVLLFTQLDPMLGSYVARMIKEDCFDLEVREKKACVGNCHVLEVRQLPYILGEVQTINDLLDLVFHEMGHAFHAFETRHLPYFHQRLHYTPIEFMEVASMSMELLGSEKMVRAGLVTKREAQHILRRHLENSLFRMTYEVQGDAFQHWLYENPDLAVNPDLVSEKWAELGRLYRPYLDWTGLEEFLKNSWQRIPHFFVAPFYYIEYTYAKIGALQIWQNYLANPEKALQQYRCALSLGTTRTRPELFEIAGTRFGGERATLQEIVAFVTARLAELEEDL